MRKVSISGQLQSNSSSIAANINSTPTVSGGFTPTGSAAEWGKITGDINDQTDLVSFVDGKVDVVSNALASEVVARQAAISTEASARTAADEALDQAKVNKVPGKGLSTNDYTDVDKAKLATAITLNDLQPYATKTYVDTGDTATYSSATTYSDQKANEVKGWVTNQGYATTSSVDSKDAAVLSQAKQYADQKDTSVLATAMDYTDDKDTITRVWVNNKLDAYRTSANQDVIDAGLQANINLKQDQLAPQVVYTNKGSSQKVPVISTNNLGQVTNISEVNIKQTTLSDLGITASAQELNYVDGVVSPIQAQLNSKEQADATILKKANVVNDVTTVTTDLPLSANQGKLLQDQINNLKNIGRFLSIWNCVTGLPTTNPEHLPYTYHTGDYFRVGLTGATNYKPDGSTYTGAPSTVIETEEVATSFVYYYDGTSWMLQAAGGGDKVEDVKVNGTSIVSGGIAELTSANAPTISISKVTDITASAQELNYMDGVTSNVQTQLNSKQATIPDLTTIRTKADNAVPANSPITAATATKITYDSKGLVTAGASLSESDIPNLSLSKITDVTASAAEINKLDGLVTTSTELGYVNGVTSSIQTQLNSKQPLIDSSNKLNADLVNDTSSTNKFVTATDKTNWDNKVEAASSATSLQYIFINYPEIYNYEPATFYFEFDSNNTHYYGINIYFYTDGSYGYYRMQYYKNAEHSSTLRAFDTQYRWSNNNYKTINLVSAPTGTVATFLSDARIATAGEIVGTSKYLKDSSGVVFPKTNTDSIVGLTATVQELNYTSGVTSNIQTQLNNKQSTLTVNPTTTTQTLTGLKINNIGYKIAGGVTSVTANNGLTGDATTGAITIGMTNPLYYDPIASSIPVPVNADTLEEHPASYFQQALVSGTNIKTINNTSLLDSGNISVQPTLVSGTNIKTINNTSLLDSGNINTYQPTYTTCTLPITAAAGTVEVNVTGITANDHPILGVLITDGTTTSAVLQDWTKVYKAETGAGVITFYLSGATTVALTIQVRW